MYRSYPVYRSSIKEIQNGFYKTEQEAGNDLSICVLNLQLA